MNINSNILLLHSIVRINGGLKKFLNRKKGLQWCLKRNISSTCILSHYSSNFNNFERDFDDRNRNRRSFKDFEDDFDNRSRRRFPKDDFMKSFELNKPDWKNLQPIEKNFYIPSEKIANQTEDEILNFRNTHNMTMKGTNIPAPIQQFSDYEFSPDMLEYFKKKGFKYPTPIQSQGWPIVLSGRDFVGIGQTGSGKTLGFILPALIHIRHQPVVKMGEGPIALVMAPTRELAQQIEEVANETMRNIKTACVFGGAKRIHQQQRLSRGPSIVIATPGRLLDFLEHGESNLHRCSFLVLDEADRMLDMGFEPQIRQIVEQTRPDRQTLMWSATWPKEVRGLASDFLYDYIQLNIGSTELKANANIVQEFEVCEHFEKRDKFIQMMKEQTSQFSKILVFAETKRNVDYIVTLLRRNGLTVRGIHGDHSQSSRDRTLDGFKEGYFNVLVATNVASRGLDVDNISLVVNYDFPNFIEDYVHRIGRTARGEKSGHSFSYLTEENSNVIKDLIKVLQENNQSVPEEFNKLLDLKVQSTRDKNRRKMSRNFNQRGSRNYYR